MNEVSENDRSNLGVVLDPNIKIRTGEVFKSFLETNHGRMFSSEFAPKPHLTLDDIIRLNQQLRKVPDKENKVEPSEKKVYLHEILCGSELVLPNLVIPERNPELENRIQKLKHNLAEKEYQKMVKNVSVGGQRFIAEDSIGYQIKQMNTGLIGIFQFIISIGAAFLFGFSGIEVFGGLELELAVKLLLGIVIALVVGMAELYFLAINLSLSETPISTTVPKKREGQIKVD